MNKLPYTLSRKTKISIERNLQSLIDKSYTEHTIKELLVDLREISKQIIKPKPGVIRNEKNDKVYRDFVDICDCIAHPNRDRGVLDLNIRQHIDKIATKLIQDGEIKFSDFSVDQVINAESLVAAMLGSISLFITANDVNFNRDQLIKTAFENKTDISLCIISLLQDTIIKLKNDHGYAFLQVLDHDGKYHLYCRVLGFTIRREGVNQSDDILPLNLSFPVLVTNAINIDNLSFSANDGALNVDENFSFVKRDKNTDQLIETYRGEDNKLHVRFVES